MGLWATEIVSTQCSFIGGKVNVGLVCKLCMFLTVAVTTSRSTEAELMRLFFGLKSSRVRDSSVMKTDVDNTSCLSSCHIGKPG